jgi:hypothetical protein
MMEKLRKNKAREGSMERGSSRQMCLVKPIVSLDGRETKRIVSSIMQGKARQDKAKTKNAARNKETRLGQITLSAMRHTAFHPYPVSQSLFSRYYTYLLFPLSFPLPSPSTNLPHIYSTCIYFRAA